MNSMANTGMQAAATVSDPRWAAVPARDTRFDGQFFCSVKSTGVFCRPSCAARNLRHGVSCVLSGQRQTAGIVFHDAA